MDPKGGELFSIGLKSEETLMEGLSDTDVQFVHINRE